MVRSHVYIIQGNILMYTLNFADDVVKTYCILIEISLKFVPNSRTDYKLLIEPMMA